jgi:hypothetical protein
VALEVAGYARGASGQPPFAPRLDDGLFAEVVLRGELVFDPPRVLIVVDPLPSAAALLERPEESVEVELEVIRNVHDLFLSSWFF